mmetsp:Transcript_17925/g.17995  ORF Transcript_17925/g.17995 Transcript_17925/m.17995 type:complete len:124 (+) Transcript_17925:100-471(+)
MLATILKGMISKEIQTGSSRFFLHKPAMSKIFFTSLSCHFFSTNKKVEEPEKDINYIHISPDGDWWLGPEIFAAKHLPDGFVKSIPLPRNFDEDLLTGVRDEVFMNIYDKGTFDVTKFKNDER